MRSEMKFAMAFAASAAMVSAASAQPKKPDFPPFAEVSKGYEKVVSTADGARPLYTIWLNKKENQLLAELPSGWSKQKHLVAVTQASGGPFAGLQGPEAYVYWKRYDKRLALITPELATRSQGEPQSRSSVDRLFTDRVLLDVPIVCMGPSGQPVIDLDDLLVNRASSLLSGGRGGVGRVNSRLVEVTKVKAFPQNIEVAVEAPAAQPPQAFGPLSFARRRPGEPLVSYHYSISNVPERSAYKPRMADERVGYFTTVFRDLGQYDQQKKWVRYIDRFHLEKRDPKLRMSPPKEPIVFYLEHTIPVRYRRWIRDGILYWNDAFRQVGLDGAIEVRIQDKSTGAHMDKDPEDVRYNFIRWLNNDVSTAIGPHRANPVTGEILDADVVLTDGWIRAYWGWYNEQAPAEIAVEGMSRETLSWLEDYPDWDPRLLLSTPDNRERILAGRVARDAAIARGEAVPETPMDPVLALNEDLAKLSEWTSSDDDHRFCMAAHGLAFDMAFARINLEALDVTAFDQDGEAFDTLDGIPEWFVGPLLAELVCHEVGHTIGLRHNFKASSIYTMEQINSEEWKGKKPLAGSVMDYLPPNFNLGTGETQGDFAMIGIGPYDMWAIEYGYTFDDPKKVLERVADPELVYLTDDDTGGPDPFARRYDLTANPHTYAMNQMRIVEQQRDDLLERFVKDGQSWSNARRGYESTLNMQTRMLSMMANWLGGSYISRDRKGDPDGRRPVEAVEAEKQREALAWLIEHCFMDDIYGLSSDVLAHMTVDKWSDNSQGDRSDPTWPVHGRISGIQASVLTMVMNPTTLGRVHDNEFRVPADTDMVTLPEVMDAFVDAVYSELETDLNGATFTNREPMVSSLRRNLQSNMTDRLIVLAEGDRRMPRAIRTLSTQHLRDLHDRVNALLEKRETGQMDDYTVAHLMDLHDRIDKSLNRIYVIPKG